MRSPAVVFAAAVLLGACVSDGPQPPDRPTDHTYGIYSAVLEELLESSRVGTLAIARTTASPQWRSDSSMVAYLTRHFPDLPPGLFDEFVTTASDTLRLTDRFQIRQPYFLLDDFWEAQFEASRRDAWSLLEERHGDNALLVQFSRPAVAGDLALVHYRFECGPSLCAEWHYVALRRGPEGWKVEKDFLSLIS